MPILPIERGCPVGRRLVAAGLLLLASLTAAAAAQQAPVEELLTIPTAKPGELNLFGSPVAWYRGAVYTINIEPAEDKPTGANLRTVVRKGLRQSDGAWRWTATVVEPRTIDDPYHTAPSIGIDKSGYVHVVYNMHNMPWQYAVSEQPGDISRFTFKGTRLSDAQIADLAADRFTAEVVRAMSDVGTAAIPGNQITYPAFFHDRHGELYVTYRFAIKPAAAPADRAFGCGIARYDVERQTWTAIGGGVADAPGVTAFCVKAGWTAYLPRLWFDKGNGMHVTWTWRRGQAGAEMTRPGYAFSADAGKTFQAADGTAYRLPITPETTKAFMGAGEDGFFAMTSLTTSPKGRIYAGVQPLGSAWSMTMREPGQALWSPPQIAPYGAQALMADDSGTVWAFASGPRILNRPADAAADAPWRLVYSSSGYNFPKVLMVPEEKAFLLHVLADDTSSARILMVHWQ